MTKYIQAVVYQMKCHNIVKRLERLEEYIKHYGFDCVSSNDLEKINKLMTQIMLKAEDDLAPSDTIYAFSVNIPNQMRRVRLIKTFLRYFFPGIICHRNYGRGSNVISPIISPRIGTRTRGITSEAY